jgi:hypothetical protein
MFSICYIICCVSFCFSQEPFLIWCAFLLCVSPLCLIS